MCIRNSITRIWSLLAYMIQETLVIFACLNSTGCEQSKLNYLDKNKDVVEVIKIAERRAKQILPEQFTNHIVPVAMILVKQEFSLNINKNISINYSSRDRLYSTKIVYGIEY